MQEETVVQNKVSCQCSTPNCPGSLEIRVANGNIFLVFKAGKLDAFPALDGEDAIMLTPVGMVSLIGRLREQLVELVPGLMPGEPAPEE